MFLLKFLCFTAGFLLLPQCKPKSQVPGNNSQMQGCRENMRLAFNLMKEEVPPVSKVDASRLKLMKTSRAQFRELGKITALEVAAKVDESRGLPDYMEYDICHQDGSCDPKKKAYHARGLENYRFVAHIPVATSSRNLRIRARACVGKDRNT